MWYDVIISFLTEGGREVSEIEGTMTRSGRTLGSTISAIQFTAKRERDTRFHLLQNTTVENIVEPTDCVAWVA
jgi:hypothetical protein